MYKECLVLLALVAAAFGRAQHKSRSGNLLEEFKGHLTHISKRSAGCEQLYRCLEDIGDITVAKLDTVTDEQFVEHVCTKLESVKDCFRNHADQCREFTVEEEARARLEIVDFMCNDQGKGILAELATSPCATNELKQVEVQEAMQGCMEVFMGEWGIFVQNALDEERDVNDEDVCPFVESLRNCVGDEAERHCGQVFRRLVGKIWEVNAREEFEQMGCAMDVTAFRRSLSNAVPMVLSHSAQIANRRK